MPSLQKNENVLIVTYWSFKDALIQTYTLPYVQMIRETIDPKGKIILVTLEQSHLNMSEEEKSQVNQRLLSEGIEWMPLKYNRFGLMAMIKFVFMIFRLWWLIGQENVNTIHTWCTPAGGIGWILSKLTGKRLILDSYEPHAEPMVEAGQWDKDSLAFRILFWLEKKQSRHANTAIACVNKMKGYASAKFGAAFDSFFVKPAGVDFNLFHPSKRKNQELVSKYGLKDKVVYVYAGKFGGSYLDDDTFKILKAAYDFYGERFGAVLLNAHSREYIQQKCQESEIDFSSVIHEFVPHHEVPEFMGLGDVGLVPFVPVPSKRYGSPIKTAEYLALGIPIIITANISDDSDFIRQNQLGYVLESLDHQEYQKAIEAIGTLLQDPMLSNRCVERVKTYRSFDQAQKIYTSIYSN